MADFGFLLFLKLDKKVRQKLQKSDKNYLDHWIWIWICIPDPDPDPIENLQTLSVPNFLDMDPILINLVSIDRSLRELPIGAKFVIYGSI